MFVNVIGHNRPYACPVFGTQCSLQDPAKQHVDILSPSVLSNHLYDLLFAMTVTTQDRSQQCDKLQFIVLYNYNKCVCKDLINVTDHVHLQEMPYYVRSGGDRVACTAEQAQGQGIDLLSVTNTCSW